MGEKIAKNLIRTNSVFFVRVNSVFNPWSQEVNAWMACEGCKPDSSVGAMNNKSWPSE